MTRQSAGVLLVVVVLLGSFLVARIGGDRIAGTASARPRSGAPGVDECVARVVGVPAGPVATVAPPSQVSVVTVGETSAAFADCSDPHVGEVVAYLSLASTSVPAGGGSPTTPSTGTDTPDVSAEQGPRALASAAAVADGQWCQMVAGTYRGLAFARYGSGSERLWSPMTGQRFVAILSAPTLDPAGPRWVACALLSPGLEQYSGSYLRSLANLPAPAPFGMCSTGEPDDRWVSCAAPHRVQDFGTAAVQDASRIEAVARCQSIIEQMTRMPDVTAGGVLRVDVVSSGWGSPAGGSFAAPDAGDRTSVATCRLSVVGAGRLGGTLIGIGDRPLPMG